MRLNRREIPPALIGTLTIGAVALSVNCARHTFGTAVYEGTGNLTMVMKVMGHTDARTAMQYQHPALDPIREAIDQRNPRHNSRRSEFFVQ